MKFHAERELVNGTVSTAWRGVASTPRARMSPSHGDDGQDDVRRPIRIVKDGLDRRLRDLLESQRASRITVDVETGKIG
jgi:hypothetical protein